MSSIIIIFHTPSNAGYAMSHLERMFFQVGCDLLGGQDKVHFAFKNLERGYPRSLPATFKNVIELDANSAKQSTYDAAADYIKNNNITTALCFDLQVKSRIGDMLRAAGVRTIISYWGAPISSINSKLKLLYKRIEVALAKNKPDLFIFESEAMRHLAVYGRGISYNNTCVIPTGVDTKLFQPNSHGKVYLENEFGIPKGKNIAFYSGHMEERKGVRVIIDAAIELVDNQNINDWHFLLCGNRPGEDKVFLARLKNRAASNHVTFAGYRDDIAQIMPGCDLGIVASTGWDSFPMSCLEMASCALPLVVSNLQGLAETIEEGKTGLSFEPGDSIELANHIKKFGGNNRLQQKFSKAARARIVDKYSLEIQKNNLMYYIKKQL